MIAELKKSFFEDVLKYAIKETSRWPMAGGMTQDQARRLLDSLYLPLGNFVYLRQLTAEEFQKLQSLINHLLATADFGGNPVFSCEKLEKAVDHLFAAIDKRNGTGWRERFAATWKKHRQDISCCLVETVHGVHYSLWTGEMVPTRVVGLGNEITVVAAIPTADITTCVSVFTGKVNVEECFPELKTVDNACDDLVRAIRETDGRLVLKRLASQSSDNRRNGQRI